MARDAARLSEMDFNGQLRANLVFFDVVETNFRLVTKITHSQEVRT